MRPNARRRLDVVLVGAAALLAGGTAAVGVLASDTEHVPSMSVGATLQPSGPAAVVEVIDYDFANNQRHGIFRDIPGASAELANVTVTSPTAPADVLVTNLPAGSPASPGRRLKIGDPSRTISGTHRYTITYDLAGVSPGDQLQWDAVGTGWEVPIDRAVVQVAAPWRFEGARCVTGTQGSTTSCAIAQPQPGRLVASVEKLKPGEGVTVYATPGEALAAAPALVPPGPPPPNSGGAAGWAGLAGFAGALLAGAGTSMVVRRKGRERVGGGSPTAAAYGDVSAGERLVDSDELAEMATIEFAPPAELTASQGGVVLAESVQHQHKVAWMLEQAIAGAIDIQAEQKPVRIVHTGFGAPDAAPVLGKMFDNRPVIELGAYDKEFATGFGEVGTLLERWREQAGLWDPGAESRRAKWKWLGLLAGILGGVATFVMGVVVGDVGGWTYVLVALAALVAGAGGAAFLRAWELRVRTPAGSGLWLRVESFRRFLAASEAYHVEEAAKRGVLREYTAWAVAVGEIDRWSNAMASAVNVPGVDRSALLFAASAHSFAAATSTASAAPSSSGGGGGGGVGGGGGGGGGGSW